MITVNFFKHSFYEKGYQAFLEDVGEEYKEKNPNAYERWVEEKKKEFTFYHPCRYEDSDTVAHSLIPYVWISRHAVTLYDYRGDATGEPDQPLMRLKFGNATKTTVDIPFDQVEWNEETLKLLGILLEELHKLHRQNLNRDDSDDVEDIPVDELTP